MRNVLCVYIFGVVMDYAQSQYYVGSTKKPSIINTCDTSKTALVEHFFNIIFNEFHNTPPVCVCVQMCRDQPTYCYPNGCLKKFPDKEKKVNEPMSDSVARSVDANPKPSPVMFFVNEKNDFIGDLMENHVEEAKLIKAEKTLIKRLRPDPFKDRYKILFKNKKAPKVELKYHHGEQVKNMKSDVILKNENLDVSNTRWPLNKNRHSNQRIYFDPQNSNGITNTAKFHLPIFPNLRSPSQPSKYFKRDLTNVRNDENDDNRVDIKAIYVVGETDYENTTFSLERLIDSLIESSYEPRVTFNDGNYTNNINGSEYKISDTIQAAISENITSLTNETTNIISMNFTNENVDKNMYLGENDVQSMTETLINMIATMSKKIDVQNNTSLEMMKRHIGDTILDTTEKIIEETTEIVTTEIVTTENVTPSIDYQQIATKKSKQRFARKLHNRKTN